MFMSGGDYDVLVENRKKRRGLNKKKHELISQIIALETELGNLRNNNAIDTLTAAPPIEKQISKLEAKQSRIERDLNVIDNDYEATLRMIFGAGYKKVRHPYIDGAHHIYYQGLGEAKGDGIGHGHAVLYSDGRVDRIREAFAYGAPLSPSSSKIYTKQMRRGKHRAASHKNPRCIFPATE